MFGLGTTELVIIFLIILIIFGVGKLPEIGGGLGKAINNFKKSVDKDETDVTPEDKDKTEHIAADTEKAEQTQATNEAEKISNDKS